MADELAAKAKEEAAFAAPPKSRAEGAAGDEESNIGMVPIGSATTTLAAQDEFIPPKSEVPSDLPSVPAGLELSALPDADYLVLSFSAIPAHPKDPLMYSRAWKVWLTALAALLVMNTALASSTPSGAATFIQDQFGGNATWVLSAFLFGYVGGPFIAAPCSEAYGRRPVFLVGGILYTVFSGACIAAPNLPVLLGLRFLAGLAGAVPTTNSGALCGDVWEPVQRGTAMSFYSIATFAGPALGPIIGSFVADRVNWRYDFVVLTAFSTLLCVLIAFTCPETYGPIILSKLARQLRKESGDDRIVSRLEYSEIVTRGRPKMERLKAEAVRLLGMPFILLFTESIVGLITAFTAFQYGLIYLLFEAYPVIFAEVHHLQPGYSSLPFLGTLFGALISVPVQLFFQKKYVQRVKAEGKHEPEMRLPPAQVGGILTFISFMWLGWTGYKISIPWIVPALSGIVQGVASVLIFRSLQTYLIDAYEKYSASALAGNVVARSLAGALFPLFAKAMFQKLGVNWACTVLAGGMLILVPVPFIFAKYGARIRANSNFAPSRG